MAETTYAELDVSKIVTKAGDNVRTGELPEIEGLAKSIAAEGVLEPILVTPARDAEGKPVEGKYSVIAGHRRLTAVRSLERPTIPALIVDADADKRLRLALIENIQREDMNPVDKAQGIAKLLNTTSLDQTQTAQALGVAPGYISQYVGILALPDAVLKALRDGDISFTHARVFCKLLPDKKTIEDLLFDATSMTASALDAKVTHLAAQAEAAKADKADEANDEDDDKPKKAKKKKPAAAAEEDVTYYQDAEFRPLKKEEIRDLMMDYKRKEIRAESEKKREEYRLILKGITLAADLRLK